jgi:predicted nucleic acid binding AN1-type Zn finger protein
MNTYNFITKSYVEHEVTVKEVQEIQKCDDCNIFKNDEQAKQEQD